MMTGRCGLRQPLRNFRTEIRVVGTPGHSQGAGGIASSTRPTYPESGVPAAGFLQPGSLAVTLAHQH